MIGYQILGISAHKIDPTMTGSQFRLYVAWQSNLPGYAFAWRCTQRDVDLVTRDEVQNVAARGCDEHNKALVKKLFPWLNIKQLTD